MSESFSEIFDRSNSNFYGYIPSLGASVSFIVLFASLTLLLIYQTFCPLIKRDHYNISSDKLNCYVGGSIPLVVGSLLELIAFFGRLGSHYDDTNLTTFVMQSVLITIAPILYAATIYISFEKLIYILKAKKYSIIAPRYLTKIFIASDLISFILEVSGAVIIVKTDGTSFIAESIIVGGHFIQIAYFTLFCITEVYFFIRYKNSYNMDEQTEATVKRSKDWKSVILSLLFSSFLILIRSIYRIVEYIGAFNKQNGSTETQFYTLDTAMMVLTLAIFVVLNMPKSLIVLESRSKWNKSQIPLNSINKVNRFQLKNMSLS